MPPHAGPPRRSPTARTPKPGSQSQPTAVACLLLLLATFVVYSNTFRGPFVFDDNVDILGNHSIRHLWPLWPVFVNDTGGKTTLHSRPIVNLSLAINYATGALDPFHYHVTNLIIHALAGLTLFGIVRRTLTAPTLAPRYAHVATPLAFVLAAVWTLHPLNTQAVTYIVQRYESMMGLFYLLSLYCVIRSDSSNRPRWWAAGAIASCLVAMGAKEVAVSIPICALLYDRAFLAGSFREAWRRRRGLYLGLAGAWVPMAALLALSAGSRTTWAGLGISISPLEYAATQLGVIPHYVRLSFWPHPLVFDYRWPVARTAAEIIPGALAVGALLTATAWALVRRPQWGTLGAWFFLILAPTSSVLPILDMAVEHRMYLALVALAAMAGIAAYESLQWLLARWQIPWQTRKWYQRGAAAMVIVALGVATYSRNRVYQSEWSLWNDVVQKTPHSIRAHNALLLLSGKLGDFQKATYHCERLLALDPPAAYAPNTLGLTLAQHGRMAEGIVQIEKALEIDPRLAMAHNNLGLLLSSQGKTDEAIVRFRKAVECDPKYAAAHYNLANHLQMRGKSQEAREEFEEALRIDPHYAEAYNNLGALVQQQGDLAQAIACYQKALWADPQNVQARGNLAAARSQR